ncbi:6-carboxytetrahydropterin synthase [Mycoavidus sp. SF9855]|uniref:6-pyruvoyl trahydropterin synthase family protein n=1 Tax=Mycoavidus sp. SF9855 TaxID=2968475 RepID=UPI00211CDA27|nr:6-carboxytetrahydropterin synthase [Mycoavidus sp. SF9855]UUM21519.1 6-carboxytetrahydropterin synthase [Mycoavidus sp. SF9855]
MLTITRKLEFDAGHRIPDHRSLCCNLHGHRYVLEITLTGKPIATEGAPDRGMVMDFAQVKALALQHLVEHWDHAFLVYAGDTAIRAFLDTLPNHKTVVLEQIPTVENLAAIAFDTLALTYNSHYGADLRLKRVRLYETPNCWAEVERPASLNTA